MNYSRPLKQPQKKKDLQKEKSQSSSVRPKENSLLYVDEDNLYKDQSSFKNRDRIDLEIQRYRDTGIDKQKILDLKEACAKSWVQLMEKNQEADYHTRKLWRVKRQRQFDEELKREQRVHEQTSTRWIKVAQEVQKRNQMLPMLQILRKQNDALLKNLSSVS